MNAHKIRPNLWIGNRLSAADRSFLATNGITTVLNVAFDAEDADMGVPIIKVPLYDGPRNEQMAVDSAVAILINLMNAGEIVLIHCVAGWSRSPNVSARALSQLESRTYDACYDEIRSIRPGVTFPEWMRIFYGPAIP